MDMPGNLIAALPPALTGAPPLLLAAGGAIVLVMIAGMIRGFLPVTGRLLGFVGNVALLAVFALTVVRFVHLDPTFDSLTSNIGMPAQTVAGGETRIPLAADGHYWIEARVNGVRQRFMVDTGATITALSDDAAAAAGIRPDPLRLPVSVRTANGEVEARMARVGELRFGSIVARDMDVIVTGSTGGLNVLGMNLLSRLKSWRVEGGVLILSPKHPQKAADTPS